MNKTFKKALVTVICMVGLTAANGAEPVASKKEIKQYENAVLLMNEGKYKEALPLLKQLVHQNKKFVDASWTLSELYGRMGDDGKRIDALKYVAQPKVPRYYNSLMRLGQAYFETCNYEESKKCYAQVPNTENGYYKNAQKRVKECETAIKLMQSPKPFNATNMGPNINTAYDDYWPSITADEGLFSTTIKINKLEGQSDWGRGVQEEIFVSKKGDDGKWQKTQNVGSSINTINNEGAQSFSLDGRYMFFVACNRRDTYGACDIYYSIRQGDKWSTAVNCGPVLNSKAWETDPCLSPTGSEMYFASTRPGGQGKSDIWVSSVTINADGTLTFGTPRNLGPNINTSDDELSPFIHADNHTLFYSSRGKEGLGNYDVFVSYKDEKGVWSVSENIGYPLNTCKDEIGFVVNAYGDKAYFSSNGQEKNGKGRDIYEIKLQDGNYVPRKHMMYTRGKIIDADTKKPIQALIDVYDINTNEKVFRGVSDAVTGEFVTCRPNGDEVGVDVDRKGYMFVSEYADKDHKLDFDKTGIKMDKIAVGKKMILKNIFFDFDKSTLRDASHHELDMLVKFMKENPTVRIRLCGHTDIVGKREYNQDLSERRAKAAYDYLVNHKIDNKRMEYKGFGSDVPIGDNKTAAGRQLNRRTEVEIIGK